MSNEQQTADENYVCHWCGEGFWMLDKSVMVDGSQFHVGCALKEADNAFFDRDMGFEDQ